MTAFELLSLFLVLVALGGWVNARTVKAPPAVAMTLVGLAGALILAGLRHFESTTAVATSLISSVGRIDFARAVLGYMLAFLLFAGAMQVDLKELRRRAWSIGGLATLGVAASTLILIFVTSMILLAEYLRRKAART